MKLANCLHLHTKHDSLLPMSNLNSHVHPISNRAAGCAGMDMCCMRNRDTAQDV